MDGGQLQQSFLCCYHEHETDKRQYNNKTHRDLKETRNKKRKIRKEEWLSPRCRKVTVEATPASKWKTRSLVPQSQRSRSTIYNTSAMFQFPTEPGRTCSQTPS